LPKTSLQNNQQGLADMPPVRFDCEGYNKENFHVVDLNGDRINDLLYNGPCMPYMQTAAFINNGITYEKIFDQAGTAILIEPSDTGSTVYVYNEAVGCIDTHRLGCYTIDRRGKLVGEVSVHWMPEEDLVSSPALQVSPALGILRIYPEIDDAPHPAQCFDDTIIGNQLLDLRDVQEVLLLQTQNDWQQVMVAHGDSNYRVAWIQNQYQNMHPNARLIQRFYEGFQQKNYRQMGECYADSATFEDPVFKLKNGKEARAMWHYLCENGKDLKVIFSDVQADDKQGSAHWEATYTFSGTGRKVHNKIDAKFEFKDGKIIMHRDHFKFYKWTRMALGATGVMLGWTPLVKNKIRSSASYGLKKFMADKPEYK
jgi:ketosteroid isomerase-like protein